MVLYGLKHRKPVIIINVITVGPTVIFNETKSFIASYGILTFENFAKEEFRFVSFLKIILTHF